MKRIVTLTPLPLLLLFIALAAGAEEARVVVAEDGTSIRYTLHTYPAGAHRLDPAMELVPSDALGTAKLVTQHLAAGRLEEVSLLSNAPKARYERLRESFDGWRPEDFVRAYGRYFAPENRIVGAAAIGSHRVLMWYLSDTEYVTAYYFVEVEGRWLLDDAPSETRAQLRQVVEAFRANRAQ